MNEQSETTDLEASHTRESDQTECDHHGVTHEGHPVAGWTRKSSQDATRRYVIAVLFFIVAWTAIPEYTIELGLPLQISYMALVPLVAGLIACQFWIHRRFERSAEPTKEQHEAWEELKRLRNRSLLASGPGAVAAVVLMALSQPPSVWIFPMALSYIILLYTLMGQKHAKKRFEETLIWFDASWE